MSRDRETGGRAVGRLPQVHARGGRPQANRTVARHRDTRWSLAVVAGFAMAAGALWLWAFADQHRSLDDTPFVVWGILAVSLGAASGLVFILGRRSWDAISTIQPISWQPLRRRTALAAVVASTATALVFAIDPSIGTLRGVGLTILAIIGSAPALTGMLGIRAALISSQSDALPEQVRAYLELRALSSQLLSALGSLVALTTFALGASMLAHGGWQGLQSVQVLLVYGGFGSTLVAMGYQIPRTSLRQQGRALVNALAPLTAPEANVLRQELEQRDQVERQLGLQSDLLSELQTGIIILSPLLAAATATLLRGG
ncbi:hypothetical protein EKO23_19530 [Nocardioides guangzhouensis]|uniref:Uncharacterized protein n=1 Tax=Nocardioides guangzhouensis TaxID=2497878 RepID=A0A4Q4Z639_9ACTN|nr:hypothetical protein [Nocardioides guangzhouensis]RYP83257.1 hypothetical protein EKO23_19530 [Nocardioides guangzhouensis]